MLLLAAFISCVLRKPDLNDDEEGFDDSNVLSSCEEQMANSKERDLQGGCVKNNDQNLNVDKASRLPFFEEA